MNARGDAPEAPAAAPRRVMPRRVVPSGGMPGAPARRRKLHLVWNSCDPEAAHAGVPVAAGAASAGAIAASGPDLPDGESPGDTRPVIAYLLTVTAFGTTGFALGLALFGTVPAALLAYLGAGSAGAAGLALLLFRRHRQSPERATVGE